MNIEKKTTIAFFTTSRSEFGILYPLIKEVEKNKNMDYLLFVGGTHLINEYGETIDEIRLTNLKISAVFDYLIAADKPSVYSESLGKCTSLLANIFSSFFFDWVCILGDRIEMLTVAINAMLFNKPILHLSGGEFTEGVMDNQVRHMLTKSAHLHFTYSKRYVQNIEQMNEEPWRIFNFGALGVDTLVKYPSIDKAELFESLGLNQKEKTAILTFHPSILEASPTHTQQIKSILNALSFFDIQLIITAPNAEINRNEIMSIIKNEVSIKSKYRFIESLGEKKYNNLLAYSDFIIGNSSSGIAYAPFFKIPTINVGIRQKGRIRHRSIIDTDYLVENIKDAIKKVLTADFRDTIKNMKYLFGNGNTASQIVEIINKTPINDKLLFKKSARK